MLGTGCFLKTQTLVPSNKKQSVQIAKISSLKHKKSPICKNKLSWKFHATRYFHLHSASCIIIAFVHSPSSTFIYLHKPSSTLTSTFISLLLPSSAYYIYHNLIVFHVPPLVFIKIVRDHQTNFPAVSLFISDQFAPLSFNLQTLYTLKNNFAFPWNILYFTLFCYIKADEES